MVYFTYDDVLMQHELIHFISAPTDPRYQQRQIEAHNASQNRASLRYSN